MDRLAWLVLGRAPNGLGGADTAYLQRIAMALLAGDKGKSQGGMLQRIGLDELSVGQGDEGTGVKSAVVTVGKQVSKRLFVGYERGLSTATGSWQLIYRIAQRVTLRARTGAENALDAIWTWRWD
jgi:translocation and assembly module TamB